MIRMRAIPVCAVCAFVCVLFSAPATYAIDLGKGLGSVTKMGEYTDQLKGLYQELMDFKDTPKFHEVGFDKCCEFAKWKEKVAGLWKSPEVPSPQKKAAETLDKLGDEYLSTKGQENDTTRSLTDTLKSALGGKIF